MIRRLGRQAAKASHAKKAKHERLTGRHVWTFPPNPSSLFKTSQGYSTQLHNHIKVNINALSTKTGLGWPPTTRMSATPFPHFSESKAAPRPNPKVFKYSSVEVPGWDLNAKTEPQGLDTARRILNTFELLLLLLLFNLFDESSFDCTARHCHRTKSVFFQAPIFAIKDFLSE